MQVAHYFGTLGCNRGLWNLVDIHVHFRTHVHMLPNIPPARWM